MVASCFSAALFRENLLKFPHLAAIQHNNCMYLAHHLLTLGHHFRAHLPQPLSEGVATFVDMVPGFRKLGKQTALQLSTTSTWNTYRALTSNLRVASNKPSTLRSSSSRCAVLLSTDERSESWTVGETFHRSQLLQPGWRRQLHCSQ